MRLDGTEPVLWRGVEEKGPPTQPQSLVDDQCCRRAGAGGAALQEEDQVGRVWGGI